MLGASFGSQRTEIKRLVSKASDNLLEVVRAEAHGGALEAAFREWDQSADAEHG